jgi:hypothetical protein
MQKDISLIWDNRFQIKFVESTGYSEEAKLNLI